jgi:V/A-type H+/Na+-transporting ATPase subunit A
MTTPVIVRITGAVVEARPMPNVSLYELAFVGERRLLSEVIRVHGETAVLQVFEDTTGLCLGEPVAGAGAPLSAQLGPGLLGSLLDGVGRPLDRLAMTAGNFMPSGIAAPTLDHERKWSFTATAHAGELVDPGDELGVVTEQTDFTHRVLVPPGVSGRIASLENGAFTVEDSIGAMEDGTVLRLAHRWPLRIARPFAGRLPFDRPFVTGQRVFDFLMPIAEGGSAAVPGGFGTGKTVVEHSLAKYSEADLVVYVGCGERGNEMAEVVREFPKLVHPATGRSVMSRAVLIANTSNMPVAAREASIYLGATIAEYYRDMGYRVALMIDSISRWAEALREISSRLQEMPGEEGYPTSLSGRFGTFLERAGRVTPLGAGRGPGALTIVSAISPPGGDLSEPVTQAALRVVGALWALDATLAHQRHFPAVDWATSYSLYADAVAPWFTREGGSEWSAARIEILGLLQRERALREIAGLVGVGALADADRLTMDIAELVRDVVLRQSAYDPNDVRSSPHKTYVMTSRAARLYRAASHALGAGVDLGVIPIAAARAALVAVRDAPVAELDARTADLDAVIDRVPSGAATAMPAVTP